MSVPKLRFKADDGSEFPEWEESSFSDIFTKLNNNTLSRDCLNEHEGYFQNIHYGDVLIKYGSVVDMATDYVPFINDEIDCSKCTLLHDGDVVVADTAEDETVGKTIEIQNLDNKKVVSGLHTMAWRPREKFAPKYLGYYMNSSVYHDQLRPYMQGIKVTSISKANIVLTTISYPSIAEQRKISGFFSIIDRVIDQTQSEIDAWEKQKRGVMQLLFSQKVRFKADDGSEFPTWQSMKVQDVCTVTNGKGNTQDKQDNGKYAFFVRSEKVERSNEYLYDKEAVITIGDGNIGKVFHYFKGKFNLHQRCYAMFDFHNVSGIYFYYYFSAHFLRRVQRLSAKGTVDSVRMDFITDMDIMVPCAEEQQKIAACLSAFDTVIDKAKQELAAYRELKKGLLQQMFV